MPAAGIKTRECSARTSTTCFDLCLLSAIFVHGLAASQHSAAQSRCGLPKGRDKWPAFDRLHKDAVRPRFDIVIAWSVDRLGRSLQGLVAFLQQISGAGIELFLFQQAIDTNSPVRRAMFQMCRVFAEFERAMIVERVRSGLAKA